MILENDQPEPGDQINDQNQTGQQSERNAFVVLLPILGLLTYLAAGPLLTTADSQFKAAVLCVVVVWKGSALLSKPIGSFWIIRNTALGKELLSKALKTLLSSTAIGFAGLGLVAALLPLFGHTPGLDLFRLELSVFAVSIILGVRCAVMELSDQKPMVEK